MNILRSLSQDQYRYVRGEGGKQTRPPSAQNVHTRRLREVYLHFYKILSEYKKSHTYTKNTEQNVEAILLAVHAHSTNLVVRFWRDKHQTAGEGFACSSENRVRYRSEILCMQGHHYLYSPCIVSTALVHDIYIYARYKLEYTSSIILLSMYTEVRFSYIQNCGEVADTAIRADETNCYA